MGLFGDSQPVRDYGSKVNELNTKIEQLEAHGMFASAARLRKELKKFDKEIIEKTKPMSVSDMKNQIRASKASGAK